ncbi:MAG: hypothetical protein AAGA92_16165 [Planctomycetota bacterium]
MTGLKIAAGSAIAAMAVGAQPTIAEATEYMEPLDGWSQLGVCGILGIITLFALRLMSRDMKRMSEAIVQNGQDTNKLLAKALFGDDETPSGIRRAREEDE